MPNYTRWKLEGATYFFTVVTAHRRPLFRDPTCRRWLGDAFREGRRRFPFEIQAIVLLPDHLHVLMTPDSGVDDSQMWRLIKTAFTRRIVAASDIALTHSTGLVHQDAPYSLSGRRSHERDVWQRRFLEHTIRDEEDWRRHVDYIHWNPVKHELVDDPWRWPWSSIHRWFRNGRIERTWAGGDAPSFPDVRE